MKKILLFSGYKNFWQLSHYAFSTLLTVWDLFANDDNLAFNGVFSYSAFFLLIAAPLFCASWLLAIKSPHWGARSAFVASTFSLVFYLGIGFTHLVDYPYAVFDITRFYLPRIVLFGATLVHSQKILQPSVEQTKSLVPLFFFKLHWSARKQKYLVVALIITVSVLGIQWLYPRASCAISGGKWIKDGIFGQAQYCLFSYSDAGNACQSSADCEGSCILEDYRSSSQPVPTAGVCAPNNKQFGCFDYLEYPKVLSVCVD